MATGYTYVITEKPETTFSEFVLRCARAFGVLMNMREEPLDAAVPHEIKPDTYHLDSLRGSEARARQLETLSLEEAGEACAFEYGRRLASWEASKVKRAKETELYTAMLEKARAWTPPTPEHVALQKFMIDQIECSIDKYEWTKPEKENAAEYLDRERKHAAESVAYHAEHWKREQASAATATKWLADLRTSLLPGDGQVKP